MILKWTLKSDKNKKKNNDDVDDDSSVDDDDDDVTTTAAVMMSHQQPDKNQRHTNTSLPPTALQPLSLHTGPPNVKSHTSDVG